MLYEGTLKVMNYNDRVTMTVCAICSSILGKFISEKALFHMHGRALSGEFKSLYSSCLSKLTLH